MTSAPEIHVLDHKVRLLQAKDGFRTSLDSVFLAAACKAQAGSRVLDLGCGVGGATFCLLWRVPDSHVTGIDIQADHVELARENITLNKMEGRAEFVHGDIRDYRAQEKFDHVICNPPYLEAGTYTPSPSIERATALGHTYAPPFIPPQAGGDERSERGGSVVITLQDWIDAAFHNLKSGGSFTIIHRADMMDKIILGFGKRFGAIETIPLWPRAGEEAKRVIIRAVKDRKTLARIHPGIVLHEDHDNSYTAQADAILRDGQAID